MTKFINFICNDQQFALAIDAVEKILQYQKPALIPDTSAYISGYQSYNEGPLILIDMKMRLFGEPLQADNQTKVIVANWKQKKIGLIVEQITQVKEYASNDSEATDSGNGKTSYLIGTFQEADQITLQIDVEKLFSQEAEQEITGLIEK